jgi:BMFP domain-containing protein YqiC
VFAVVDHGVNGLDLNRREPFDAVAHTDIS